MKMESSTSSTADDIRNNASSWSLEGDAKLLVFMKNISKKLEERGNRTTHNLHKMQLELDRTQVALGNTTNKLLALQHTQFVENRVYDDDETITSINEVPAIRDVAKEDNMKPMEVLKLAVDSGLKMMDSFYDKVPLDLSDSDEDDADNTEKSFVYRPKDLYQDRPLPHLIGSKEWHDKWHVGLVDSDAEDASDNEGANEIVRSSTSSSSSSLASLPSHAPTTKSESENSYWNVQAVTDSLNKRKVDLFENSSDEEKSALSKAALSDEKSKSEEEKSTRSGERESKQIPEIKNSSPKQEQIQQPTSGSIFLPQKQEHQPVIVNIFDSEPPELFDDDKDKKSERRPVNLFLESDEEDNSDYSKLFGKKSQAQPSDLKTSLPASNVGALPTAKRVNLFDENTSDEDDFDKIVASTTDKKKEVKKSGLFEDDNVSEREKIESKSKPSSVSNQSLSADRQFLRNLFDDEPPDDDFAIFKKKDSVPGEIKPDTTKAKVALKSVNLFENEENPDFDEVLDKKSKPVPLVKSETTNKTEEKVPTKSVAKTVNLFDDLEEDDDFDFLIKKTPTTQKASTTHEKERDKTKETAKETRESSPKKDKSLKSEKENVATGPSFTQLENNTSPDNRALDYTSFRLFDDIPPDDDDNENDSSQSNLTVSSSQDQNVNKSKLTNIFYDDFSETITQQSNVVEKETEKPQESSQWSASAYLFNDEPPPDDQVDEPSVVVDTIKENNTDFNKKLNLFAGNQQNEPLPNVEKQPIRQPKKLDIKKFDINVAALLPSSKRTPIFSKPTDGADDVDKSKDARDEKFDFESSNENVVSTVKNITTENFDSSGRLIGMNKNRARNSTARRPSTRRGRQQQYQKSLETDVFGEAIVTTDGVSQIEKQSKKLSESLKSVNIGNAKINVEEKQSRNSNEGSPIFKKVEQAISTQRIEKVTSSYNKKDLFSDATEIRGNTTTENIFSVTAKNMGSPSKLETDRFSDNLTSTLDNLFLPTAKTKESSTKVTEKLFKTAHQIDVETPNAQSDHIFSSPFEDENRQHSRSNDLFVTKTANLHSKEKSDNKINVLEKSSIFGDDEVLDEGLFEEKPPEIKSLPKSKAIAENKPETKAIETNKSSLSFLEDNDPNIADDDWLTSVINEKPPPLNESHRTSSNDKLQKSSWGLFGEEESENEDDDWLLPSTTETPKSSNVVREEKTIVEKSPATKNVTSLFGDEDDDDLFSKPPPLPDEKSRSKPSTQTKAKEKDSLFGDGSSEDDDALFGGGTNRAKSTKKDKKEPLASTAVIKSKALDKNSSGAAKLFSDSEDYDNDDLFSSKKKVSNKTLPKQTGTVQSKIVKPAATATAVDDPLADLLK